MRRTGFDPHEMVLLGTPPSQDDKPWAEFEKLATPLFDSLYNFARWLVRNQGDAEDLVQETYRKALLSFGSFQPSTNFRAWMFRILKNTFLSSCSRLERRMTVAMDSEQDGPETGGGDREGSSGWDRPARQIAMRGFAQFRVVSARMDVPNPEEHCNVSRFSPELSQLQFCYF